MYVWFVSKVHLKSFIAKRVNSILVNLRYLRFKLLKYKGNKKICNTFVYNFKNIPLYIMRKVSLERYYFVLCNGALTLKCQKSRLTRFAIKLFILWMVERVPHLFLCWGKVKGQWRLCTTLKFAIDGVHSLYSECSHNYQCQLSADRGHPVITSWEQRLSVYRPYSY